MSAIALAAFFVCLACVLFVGLVVVAGVSVMPTLMLIVVVLAFGLVA